MSSITINNKESIKIPIFAYLRRSTNKKEQEESLIQQEDGIHHLVNRLHLDADHVRYFAETRSGFENKTRPEWERLISEMDKSKEPCIVLVRDISRLSRNPTDSQKIMDRLYGDNKTKQKIDKIYALEYDKVKEWNSKTDKEEVHRALSSSYYDSLDTKRKSIGGILLKLGDHQFVYAAPKGFDKHWVGARQILKCNDEMPFVRRAFEMKTEGKTHKEISKFLKNQANINIGERDLTDRLFRNSIYIGEYTEKTTGSHFNNLEFFEKEPPISRALWDKIQNCLGKKISHYGEKQEDHLFGAKLKSESGHLFSKYLAKGTYPTYKGKYKNEIGADTFIHIAEKEIISSFLKGIGEVITLCSKKHSENLARVIATGKEELFADLRGEEINQSNIEEDTARLLRSIDFEYSGYDLAVTEFSEELKAKFMVETKELRLARKGQIERLETEKRVKEEEKKAYRRNAYIRGVKDEELDETTKYYDDQISQIQGRISDLSCDTEMEAYLEKLPDIFFKTVELVINPLRKAEVEQLREDVKKLLEITTVELTIGNKKELRIKLFDVLDALISSDKSALEAPSGVEPDYGALQAPA